MKGKIIAGIIVAVLIALGLYGYLYYDSLTKLELRDFYVNDLEDLSLDGFTLEGNINVYNGGVLTVGMDHIEYNVTMESTGALLAQGNIEGKKIQSKEITEFSFLATIEWVPTIDTAVELISAEQVNVIIKGDVYVADIYFTEIIVPFEHTVDIKPYVMQFAQQKIEEGISGLIDTITGYFG